MKRISPIDVRRFNRRCIRRLAGAAPDREGSTIVVVIGLLGALLLLGLMVFTISTQEETNAEYYADASKVWSAELNRDFLFDWSLRQLILGAAPDERNSALWGGRHSLLPTLYGRDMAPYSGEGINLIWAGGPAVDSNYDGTPDPADAYLLAFNHSPAAQGSILNMNNYPAPDAGYTYPDINNTFARYSGYAPTGAPPTPGWARVELPSFHRPQYLRGLGVPAAQWYTSLQTVGRVMRPHVEHRAVDANGNVSDVRRFVSATYPDTDPNPPTLQPFAFDGINGFTGLNDGVWNGGAANAAAVQYDVDTDGDGVRDAVWLDLGFPIQERTTPTGTEKFVPLFAMSVQCADSLFNLNAHGDIARYVNVNDPRLGGVSPPPSPYAPDTEMVSRSNEARSTYEVNPLWALTANLGALTASDLEQYQLFFRRLPADPVELANMDLWFLHKGRPQINDNATPANPNDDTVDQFYAGKLGEVQSRLRPATVNPSTGVVLPSKNNSMFPLAGTSGQDDNNNGAEGGAYSAYSMTQPAPLHPIDLFGTGQITRRSTGGRARLLATAATTGGAVGANTWPQYRRYFYNPQVRYHIFDQAIGTGTDELLVGSAPFAPLQDEAFETWLEPSDAAGQSDDQIFGADEAAALHLSNADRLLISLTGRTSQLAPANFEASPDAETIRRRFTTASWDLKSFAKPRYPATAPASTRPWEFNLNPTSNQIEFPPSFPGIASPIQDPFRPELRELLRIIPGQQQVRVLQRKLSLNQILDRTTNNGPLRFRPLTPHPTTLPNTPVPAYDVTNTSDTSIPIYPERVGGDALKQEFLARYDRQRLCRDIYVLLYTLGGGDNGDRTTTPDPYNSTINDPNDPMNPRPLHEFYAQFAVNWVDALDPDDVVTAFEYDTDLSDGWNMDDNPFTDLGSESNRGLVFGVESQRLALNEALVIYAPRVEPGGSNDATEYNDDEARDFTYIELENISPSPVAFDHEAWQIAIKPDDDPAVPLPVVEERRLTLTALHPQIPAANNTPFTIGTAGDTSVQDTMGSGEPYSYFKVDEWEGSPSDPGAGIYTQIAPRGTLNLDLIRDGIDGNQLYRVNEGATSGAGDGPLVQADATNPSGSDFLHLDPTAVDPAGGSFVIIELRRRMNPNRDQPVPAASPQHTNQSQDNPWIVVDRLRVPIRAFQLRDSDDHDEIQPKLQELVSTQRNQPLNRNSESSFDMSANAPDDFRLNSLGARNILPSGPVPNYSLYQPHFDRDLASIADLFTVPLYGPDELTLHLPLQRAYNPDDTLGTPFPRLAGNMFLHPRSTTTPALDNRWYRLLSLLELPARGEKPVTPFYESLVGKFGSPLGKLRKSGLLQLNMMFDPAMLAGLLDDREVVDSNLTSGDMVTVDDRNTPADATDDVRHLSLIGADGRNWWWNFLRARDGEDPAAPGTGLCLPGVPPVPPAGGPPPLRGSRPFRPLDYVVAGNMSMEHTVLRPLPGDVLGGVTPPRRLFDVGTANDVDGDTSNGEIDPTLRHRLLQKVANNSTNRSNVFLVSVQVDFFEAKEVQDASGRTVTRIGAKLADSPGYRGFFVVDRSKALELVQPKDLPQPFNDPISGTQKIHFAFNQGMNWRSLILHRQTIK